MFGRKQRLTAILVAVALISLLAAPALVGAQEAENGFTAPTEGATVSGTVDITGYAAGGDFDKWDLYVLPGGDDSAKIWLSTGTDQGEFSVTVDTTNFPDGDHVLSLRVVRATDGNYTEYQVPFTIANAEAAPAEEPAAEEPAAEEEAVEAEEPAAEEEAAPAEETAAPTNGFDAEDGIEVSGTVTVTAYADTAGFDKWQLDVIPFGNADDAIFQAVGTDAGEISYELDTTQFPDGDHQLRLRVVDNTGNYDEYFVDVTIANGEAEPAEVEAAPVEATATVTDTATTTETVEAREVVAAPAETAEMENGLDVEEGATVSGTVDITGYAAGDDFEKWDLYVLPGGDDSAKIWLGTGTDQGEFSVTVDTTNFPDGDHVLSLRVVRASDSNYTEYLVPFTIANAEAAAGE